MGHSPHLHIEKRKRVNISVTKATLNQCADLSEVLGTEVAPSVRTLQKRLKRNSMGSTSEKVIEVAITLLTKRIEKLKLLLQYKGSSLDHASLAAEIEHEEKVLYALQMYQTDTLATPGLYGGPVVQTQSIKQWLKVLFASR